MTTETKKGFKLSSQGRIASAVSMALVLPMLSVAALADNIRPVGDTSVSQVGNVDVVNIANPNSQGLSHNKYKDFNVSKSGAVLNNSLQSGQSQLAGQLDANTNLSESASVILNEVVSKNPSLLLGQQEVFGMAADYILANPNGISGENIGFINTNRASLVVGKPTIEEERLAGFSVGDRNNKTLALSGDIDGDKRLDLLAPKIDINGNIKSSEAINVISGRNNIDYDTLQVTDHERRQPHVTLDGQILGSMNSGRIRLHNTDAKATQTLQGQFKASKDFDAAANTLKVVDSEIAADNVSLSGSDQLYVGGNVQTERTELPEQKQKLEDGVILTNSGYKEVESFKGSSVAGNNVDLKGGDVNIEGSNIEAASINAAGDTVNIIGVTTTNTDSSTARNSKGLWFNENESLDKSQAYHQSSLKASDDINITSNDDTHIAGADINAAKVELTSGNDLVVTSEITENSHSDINRYKNETADLKSGSRTITTATQTGNQTSITGSNVSLNSGNNQRLEGVQLSADTAKLNSAKDLTVANSSASNRQTDEEDFKYWGGIGGGETHINNSKQTALTGSQITANEATLESGSNINVTASSLKADNKLAVNAAKDLNISNGFATEQDNKENRHGSAFNITDKKDASERLAQSTVASKLAADQVDLQGDNIRLTGSDVAATDNLTATANTSLTTNAANPTDITRTETYDITSEGSASSNLDLENSLNKVLENGVDGLLKGGLIAEGIDKLKNFEFEASGSLKGVTNLTTKGTGDSRNSSLTANNVALAAQDTVSLNGTDIKANNKVTIAGNNVTTGATEALTAVNSSVNKSTGPEAYIRGGWSGVEVGVSLDHNQIINEHNEYQAANSSVTAGKEATLSAKETLTNQGTQFSAPKVNLEAQDVINEASADRVVDRVVVAGGDAALEAYAGLKPLVGGSVNLSGKGEGITREVTTANTTTINATDSATIQATNTAVDAGTQITAKSININADDYTGTAAYNSDVTTTHSGSGDVDISVGTDDLTQVSVNAGGKGTYQYLQTGKSNAVKGNLKADTVTINAGTKAAAAQNVTAKQYNVNAGEEARIAQDSDKKWTTEGGAKLGGSTGVTVIPAAVSTGVGVLPSVSGQAGFNYLGAEDTQAKAAAIDATNLSVQGAQLAQVDGATINSDNVTIKGNRANIAAAQDTHRAVGVAMDGNGGFAPDLSKLGFGADLGVVNETSNKATGATIKANNLTVVANEAGDALVTEGANITAENIDLTNANVEGNVLVKAAESKDYIGNFGIGANLGGSADKESFESSAVGAHLKVETDNSSYYKLGNIQADTITINGGNDISLQSNLTTGTLNTTAGNGLHIRSAQDEIAKVDVNTGLSLDGSPVKFIEGITAGNVIEALTNDFNNGTILGVSAAGEAGFEVDHQKTTHQASVKADTLNAKVGSGDIAVNAAKVKATTSDLGGATVSSTDNDDFKHKVGAKANAKSFSVPAFVKTIPGLIKDALVGKPVEVNLPVNIDVTHDWDDKDGSNTKSDISL